MKKKRFADQIISFYERCGRNFPWRKTRDPYVILVSEIMLRKTTAQQVSALFEKFFSKYPTLEDLAKADTNELKNLLRPLGMEHRRSEQLIKLAKILVEKHGGKVPTSVMDLMTLPGVGRYAASAVACLAYEKDEAMVDTNVVRVVTRYFGFKAKRKRPREDPTLWEFVKTLIPPGRCREFNLGLLDFASSICTARNPKCGECPLNVDCNFYQKRRITKS